MRACTIIAKNYIAQARVLARSFLEHNPGSEFNVLIIDELEGLIDPATEPFGIITPADIDCRPFERMAARYDVVELSTAVKPWLLRHQLAGADTITYLDPDIHVFGSLELLAKRAQDDGLVLTPHNTTPIPDDGERPTQIDIMIAGVYNLGFVSIGHSIEIEQLLDWWSERLTRDCRVDPVYGYFVDQRWFDLAPGFVSRYAIVREPEYNVAYWNAHARRLTHDDAGYQVDGRPLAFFHFSGFDPRRPEILSRHQTRIDLAGEPELARICAEYAQSVLDEGYAEAAQWSYTYGRLPDGTAMTPPLRALYGQGEDDGTLRDSPFVPEGCEQFLSWAAQQQEGASPGVNRALAAAYGTRVDLRTAFPDLNGAGREPFLQWASARGLEELGLPHRLLPTRSSQSPAAPVPPTDPDPPRQWGVNVVGYFRSELGVGEAARQAVSGLDAVAIPLLPLHGATIPLNRQGHSFQQLDHTAARYPVNLICMNADAVPEFAAQAGPSFFADRYSIGLWFWEVTTAPPGGWASAFGHLDEVWVPTAHVRQAVALISPLPVTQVTIPIEMPTPTATDRRALGLPDGCLFLVSFDYLSVFRRKNPLAVIDAFKRAFDAGSGVSLAIKCINQAHDPRAHAGLLEAAAGRDDIHVLDRYLSPEEKNALTAACDCYVSLHRAEGFGLTMAEAMYLGKPVIATGYSGNLDFMTADNSFLVDHEIVSIGAGAEPYPADGVWAEPDVEHAAALMRAILTDPEAAAARGRRAAADVRRTHSAAAAGARMAERLEVVRQFQRPRPRRPVFDDDLREALRRGPVAPTHSAVGPLGPLLRRGVLRLIKPFSSHQRTVDDHILRSLEAVDRALGRVGDAQLRSEAAGLAWSRRLGAQTNELRHDADLLLALRQPIVDRLNDVSEHVQQIEAGQRAIPYMATDAFTNSRHPVAGIVQGFIEGRPHEDVYRDFEDIFRGSEEFIRDRQRAFISVIGDRRPVLDFGCGRGEFLDLLSEHGIPHMGVDSDDGMVARCREKGHEDVTHADGVAFLEGLAPGSLGAIFAAQVIEHLPYDVLLRFLGAAHRALAPGGLLIAETVNPHSPPALKTFWVDLTHQKPIFPEVALELVRTSGFAQAFVFHPNGTGEVDVDRYTQGEYAVVAQVAQSTTLSSGGQPDADGRDGGDGLASVA